MSRGGLVLALLLVLLSFPAAAGAHPGHGPVFVELRDFQNRFDPASVTVGVGDPVIWNWGGALRNHSVTADDGSFDSDPGKEGGQIQHPANDQYVRTFTTPGRFAYHCKVHPNTMYGQVEVVSVTGSDVIPPQLSQVRVSKRKGRHRVHFTLSEAGDVLARIRRKGRTVRSFDLPARPGENRGRIPTDRLDPGRYRIVLTAFDRADNRSPSLDATFRVRRR